MQNQIAIALTLFSFLVMGQNIDTEFKYTDSAGKDIIIQNSGPRGGGNIDGDRRINAVRGYYDSIERIQYAHGIFWTRIINETSSPLELSINFPSDSLTISPLPNNYFKLFLPPDNYDS